MHFCQPPAELRRYVASFYVVDVDMAEGTTVTDYLHPEWGNLRFHDGAVIEAVSGTGHRIAGTTFSATGPTAHAVKFSLGPCRIWGLGLLPAGWAKFMAVPAETLADVVTDGWQHPAYAGFRDLAAGLFTADRDSDREFARITDFFTERLDRPSPHEARITAIHEALVDPETSTVAELMRRVGGSPSTLERTCRAAFGFSPKRLLRRQRFARSLAQYMLADGATWIESLDEAYHDQSQFVREFRAFMGMSPGTYGAMAHPILDSFVRARQRLAGAPLQALVLPSGWDMNKPVATYP